MESNYIIHLSHEGTPCWHIIRASKIKEPMLSKLPHGEKVDVSSLGTVLESGWGSDIPLELKLKYNVKVEFDE